MVAVMDVLLVVLLKSKINKMGGLLLFPTPSLRGTAYLSTWYQVQYFIREFNGQKIRILVFKNKF